MGTPLQFPQWTLSAVFTCGLPPLPNSPTVAESEGCSSGISWKHVIGIIQGRLLLPSSPSRGVTLEVENGVRGDKDIGRQDRKWDLGIPCCWGLTSTGLDEQRTFDSHRLLETGGIGEFLRSFWKQKVEWYNVLTTPLSTSKILPFYQTSSQDFWISPLSKKNGENQKLCVKLQQSLGVSHHCASGPKVIINSQQGTCPEAQGTGEMQSRLWTF